MILFPLAAALTVLMVLSLSATMHVARWQRFLGGDWMDEDMLLDSLPPRRRIV